MIYVEPQKYIRATLEHKVQNEEDDDLLDWYKDDNYDYGPLLDSKNEHLFSRISHTLGGQMFNKGTKPIKFRERMVFKNFKAFAWL